MKTHVQFVVCRASFDEITFAVVGATVRSGKLRREDDFLAALEGGITEWMKKTKVGRSAWKRSSNDFNVGDLFAYVDDPFLVEALRKRGITALSIDIHSASDPTMTWNYDRVLVEEEELEP